MRKIQIALFAFLISLTSYAQNLSSVIISMPDDLLPGMDAEMKERLSDPLDTSGTTVQSSINEGVKRLDISDSYISLQTSENGTLQIKLLPLINNTKIVGVISTVCGKACDSNISFYTTDWKPLLKSDMFPEKDKAWFLAEDADINSEAVHNAYAALDMSPITLSFSSQNSDITAAYDIKNYLSKYDYKHLEPYLIKTPVVFKWDNLSYKR